MNVLVIAAHPDDEVLGCGGTIARLASEGHTISILILGEGITSRYPNRSVLPTDEISALHANSREVARLCGAREVELHDFPDNRFDTVPLLEVVKVINASIERVQPEIVFTQHGGDLNGDHATTFRATLIATRPVQGQSVRAVYGYEVASSSEWAFGQFAPIFVPNVFWNIESFVEVKIAAMQLYDSEARHFPHPRSPESLRARAVHWGTVVGCNAAEAFVLVREVK